jgi:hypothetical protein
VRARSRRAALVHRHGVKPARSQHAVGAAGSASGAKPASAIAAASSNVPPKRSAPASWGR